MDKIKLKNVRLSFPSLFNEESFAGVPTGKFAATFILDKVDHAKEIKVIQAAIKEAAVEKLKGKIPPADKLCLKDGDDTEREEMQGKMTLKASTKKRPLVIDNDKTPLAEQDNRVYAGCYVNGIVTLWAQDNQFGKRINAQLDGVQFYADGEPFADNYTSVEDFDVFGDNEQEF